MTFKIGKRIYSVGKGEPDKYYWDKGYSTSVAYRIGSIYILRYGHTKQGFTAAELEKLEEIKETIIEELKA